MPNLDIFRNDPSIRPYAAGDVIFEAGEPGKAMFVVVAGDIELRLGNGVVLATVGPGEVFGEMALIEDLPRSATAIALTAVQIVPIDERRFTYLVQNTPYFAIEVMRTMAHRVRLMNESLTRN